MYLPVYRGNSPRVYTGPVYLRFSYWIETAKNRKSAIIPHMVSRARARSASVRKYENEGITIFFLFPFLTLGFIHSKVFVRVAHRPFSGKYSRDCLCLTNTAESFRIILLSFQKGSPGFHAAPSFGARHSVGPRFSRVFVSFPRAGNTRRPGSK